MGRGTESLSFKELPCSFATYVHTLKREVYQKQAEVSLAAGNIESALSYLKSSSLHSLAADSERQKELDVELSREIEKCPEDVQILIVKPDYAKRLKERLSGREFQMEDQKDQEMLFQPKPGGNEREVNPLERIYFGRELLFIALRVFLDESSSKQPTPFQIKEEIAALEPVIIEDWIDFMKQIPSLPKHYGYSQQTKDFFQLEQNKDLPCRGILQLTTR